jgi:hypothetical protein
MQSTVRTTLDNPRITATVYIRGLLERLAKAAKMDWFLLETQNRKTLTGEQVTSLSDAFIHENFYAFDDGELFEIFSWYARLQFDTSSMAQELIAYFRTSSKKDE